MAHVSRQELNVFVCQPSRIPGQVLWTGECWRSRTNPLVFAVLHYSWLAFWCSWLLWKLPVYFLFPLSHDLQQARGGCTVLCPESGYAVRSPLTMQACLQVTDKYACEDPRTVSLFLFWWKEMARWAYLIIQCTWKRLLAVAPPGCLSDMLI